MLPFADSNFLCTREKNEDVFFLGKWKYVLCSETAYPVKVEESVCEKMAWPGLVEFSLTDCF